MHHPDLHALRAQLQDIHDRIADFQPLTPRPPIIDSYVDVDGSDDPDDGNWLQQEPVPGLKKLKENIKLDLGVLEKFLDDPNCANLPPLSTNAPYLIAVWNEAICAPPPIVSVFKTYNTKQPSDAKRPSGARGQKEPSSAVKVDVVAENGRQWIRVNTIKNSRLLAEFREIDSYLTDSSDDGSDYDVGRPTLAQREFDNSILRMGRALIDAAAANPIPGTDETPRVALRLTRLDPTGTTADKKDLDTRIDKTIALLQEMGINVELGERSEDSLAIASKSLSNRDESSPSDLLPTLNINLDLSMLIALISDLTHAPLPASVADAKRRFIPPPEYREWKQKKQAESGKPPRKSRHHQPRRDVPPGQESTIDDLPYELIKHSRALTNQLLQEMGHSMMQEIGDRIREATSVSEGLSSGSPSLKTTFWTTSEARDRCLRIVSKIGGVQEKRRARALFCLSDLDLSSGGPPIPLTEAQALYWQDSRFAMNFIPLQPIRIFGTPAPPDVSDSASNAVGDGALDEYLLQDLKAPKPLFFRNLDRTCTYILSQDIIPHPRAAAKIAAAISANATASQDSAQETTPAIEPTATSNATSPVPSTESSVPNENGNRVVHRGPEIQRASVTKANPRLTAHTVQTMQWGARLGWTTLTANRTSVKAMIREMKQRAILGKLSHTGQAYANSAKEDAGKVDEVEAEFAAMATGDFDSRMAIWIMSPRSLAEGISSQQT